VSLLAVNKKINGEVILDRFPHEEEEEERSGETQLPKSLFEFSTSSPENFESFVRTKLTQDITGDGYLNELTVPAKLLNPAGVLTTCATQQSVLP